MNKPLNDLKPGDVISLPGWIWAVEYGGYQHVNNDTDMSPHGYTRVCPVELVGVVPAGFNAVEAQVAAVDEAIEALKTEYHRKLGQLNETKQNLLALPAPQATSGADFDDIPF